MNDAVKQQIANRFAVIGMLGQSNVHLTADHVTIKEIPSRSRTRAEVSTIGSSLRVHPEFFPTAEVESRIATYIHEVAHLGMNDAHHKPEYWEHFASVCNAIVADATARQIIAALFTEEIDWHKVRYRAIQDVNEKGVDKRMETVEERQRQLAQDIDGYAENVANFFDLKRYSWSSGDPQTMFFEDEYSLSLSLDEIPVSASDYSDEELEAFIREHGTEVDDEHITFTAPITYTKGSIREFADVEYAHRMAAVCDRRGMDYCPMTTAEAVVDEVIEHTVSKSVKRACENAVSVA